MLSIDEARTAVLSAVTRSLPAEEVALTAALGRVLAEDVVAAGDVPPFANSAMDGYAVKAGGTGRELRVVDEARAGEPASHAVGDGEAIRIATGAMLPVGAEAVLPVEEVEVSQGGILARAEVAAGRHVRLPGEDVRAGEVVLEAGTRLEAAEVGVAAGAGRAGVACARAPRVVILVTGDELRPPGTPLGPGQIHDSNGLTLGALAARAGAEVLRTVSVPDAPGGTREAFRAALADADVVVASGGVSVGPHDHVKGALGELGVQERFWRVALRPGKPTWFGTRDATLVFGLPGNPVSAMVTFCLFARPALLALQGAPPHARRVRARLAEAVERMAARDQAFRVRLRDDGVATPTGPQGSHQLTSMLRADGLAIVPAGEGALAAGDPVEVELL